MKQYPFRSLAWMWRQVYSTCVIITLHSVLSEHSSIMIIQLILVLFFDSIMLLFFNVLIIWLQTLFNPFLHIDAFWHLCSRQLFENIVTKEEITQNKQHSIIEIFYFLTKYVQSRLLQNCRMMERVKIRVFQRKHMSLA